MKVVGFERLTPALDEEIGSVWIIPPRHSAEDLGEYKDLIDKTTINPPTFENDETAENQIRRKTGPRKKATYDDDEDDDNDFLDDDDALFPKNARWEKFDGRATKKRRIRRRKDALGSEDDELPSDEELAEKARRRRSRDLEKQRKIKSALMVDPADDESDNEGDAEFFAREEAIRQRVSKALQSAQTDASQVAETMRRLMADSDDDDEPPAEAESDGGDSSLPATSRKRKSDVMLVDDASGGEEGDSSPPPAKKVAAMSRSKTRLGFLFDSSDEEDSDKDDADPSSAHVSDDEEKDTGHDSDADEMDTDDTPLSSHPKNADADEDEETADDRSPLKENDVNSSVQMDEQMEEDDVPVVTKRRPRMKSGFVMDDSDED